MRRRIELYIDGRRADIDDASFVVFNWRREDTDNPAVIRNSWSNSVTLPGTPDNDVIFSHAFRCDRRYNFTPDSFDPSARTPFAIYQETGEILVSGYCKLDSVARSGATHSYKVTLFGVLGSLLYGLSYDANGDALTLADLDYLETGNPETELDFTINRANLLTAWQDLAGGQPTIFGVVNFAPAYNGLPANFAADKCLFDLDAYEYGAAGQSVANLSKQYTEREMADFRSYLQRPVVRVSAVLDAIVRAAADLGYTLDLSGWDYVGNNFAKDTWMTLPMLKDKRSGDTVTKADLLGGTMSPAAFLLGIVKTFGLSIICNQNAVSVVERGDFYLNARIDLTDRVETGNDCELVPLAMEAKWYEFSSEDGGEFAASYKERYGRIYGSQRVNTGYDFDSSVKQVVSGLPFRGAAQSCEFSSAFRKVQAQVEQPGSVPYLRYIPSAFLDGGTYAIPDGLGGQIEKSLLTGIFFASWWNAANNGYDEVDLPQLHGPDNKALDGSGVLLFYLDQPSITAARISDDHADMGEEPCWNCSSVNTTSINVLPRFSRFQLDQLGKVETSLDWGEAQELNVPGLSYAGAYVGIYGDFWRAYLSDRLNVDTKVVRVKADLSGLQVGPELLRKFVWWDGCLWTINAITNYSLSTYDPAEVELVQVHDINNYI